MDVASKPNRNISVNLCASVVKNCRATQQTHRTLWVRSA